MKKTGDASGKPARLLLTALALSALLSGGAGAADFSQAFLGCDGYGAPTSSGDGMTQYAMTLGIFSLQGKGTTERFTSASGATGVAACDTALTNNRPEHWMRKVSLLRARAVHNLEEKKPAAALADLDLAKNSAPETADIFYQRSLGLGVDMVRAFALRQQGDQAAGAALALQTMGRRPYNSGVPSAALIAVYTKADADYDNAAKAMARIWPEMIDLLYTRALEKGHYAEALDLYPQLIPTKAFRNGSYNDLTSYEFDLTNNARAEIFWAQRSGYAAYASAVLGNTAQAQDLIARARVRAASATQDPPTPTAADESTSAKQKRFVLLNHNVKLRSELTKLLDLWAQMVERRTKVSQGKGQEIIAGLAPSNLPANWATLELLGALKATGVNAPAITDLSTSLKAELDKDAALPDNVALLIRYLPEAEIAGRIPKYREAKRPMLAMKGSPADLDAEGYRDSAPNADGVQSIRYRGDESTSAIIEEMSLLRAADLARQAGKKGFIVVGRRITKHSVVATYYGTPTRSDPNGYEAEFDVLAVDPAALPPAYAKSSWRVIDADAVYNALGPIYAPPAPAK